MGNARSRHTCSLDKKYNELSLSRQPAKIVVVIPAMVVVDKQADGIHAKHLFTLQPGISENQTEEMKKSNLQLVVVPEALKTTYTNEQQGWRWCF